MGTQSTGRGASRAMAIAAAIAMAVASILFMVSIGFPEAMGTETAYGLVKNRKEYTLTEAEWGIIDELIPQCRDVATGARTSVIFSVNVSGLLGKTDFTDKDFGIEVVDMEHIAPDGQPEMNTMFTDRIHSSLLDSMTRCLWVIRNDRPSLMDWFDGATGCSIETHWAVARESDGWHARLGDTSVYMHVNATCRSDTPYEVSPEGIRRIQRCVANAQEIVNRHAGEPAEQMIRSWASEIDSLTTYAADAQKSHADGKYHGDGDPWFFASAFDGDPSTQTICEGYAKAFRLLFELSNRDDVSCLTVYGSVRTLANADNHAWNVVRMPDGRSYLVDLTNNRTGSPGEGQFLLIPGKGSPDTEYEVRYDDGIPHIPVWYAYGEKNKTCYDASSLTLADTPYVAAVRTAVAGDAARGDVLAPTQEGTTSEEAVNAEKADYSIDTQANPRKIVPNFEISEERGNTSATVSAPAAMTIVLPVGAIVILLACLTIQRCGRAH